MSKLADQAPAANSTSDTDSDDNTPRAVAAIVLGSLLFLVVVRRAFSEYLR